MWLLSTVLVGRGCPLRQLVHFYPWPPVNRAPISSRVPVALYPRVMKHFLHAVVHTNRGVSANKSLIRPGGKKLPYPGDTITQQLSIVRSVESLLELYVKRALSSPPRLPKTLRGTCEEIVFSIISPPSPASGE